MRLSKIYLIISCVFTLSTHPSSANEFGPALEYYLENEILHWSQSEIITSAIKTQNTNNENITQTQIDIMDISWRNNFGRPDIEPIASVLNNDTANFLREKIEESDDVIREIFIMDENGLNVAASHITSDYWQGDEAKFQKTYGTNVNNVHIGEVEFDDSTQSYLGQISITIVDPTTGKPIGAMTVGIDAESLL